ncbi:pyridoxamine 5'-phosphate oxidase family protein [Poseidonocella sp. HB161398]|uniref:pyridoxamine 5'-phosphate oxidase family protein n=1 Tax=Poseidonocella sp. HB161398 TaxID=2320855 RepID=UPI00110969ED|nr:pyridoxamine 5'-phosphate oxidase family protein [Poseidonocella sp. HB161398]
MRIDDDLIDFFGQPLMCIIAAADSAGRPAAGRGIGFELLGDRETIDVIFSGWQWPEIARGIEETGRMAATFVSPSDYVSFQLKGMARMRATLDADLVRSEAFMAAATAELAGLGVAPHMILPWLTARGACVARLAVSEIYVQTPGPLAGMRAGTAPQ